MHLKNYFKAYLTVLCVNIGFAAPTHSVPNIQDILQALEVFAEDGRHRMTPERAKSQVKSFVEHGIISKFVEVDGQDAEKRHLTELVNKINEKARQNDLHVHAVSLALRSNTHALDAIAYEVKVLGMQGSYEAEATAAAVEEQLASAVRSAKKTPVRHGHITKSPVRVDASGKGKSHVVEARSDTSDVDPMNPVMPAKHGPFIETVSKIGQSFMDNSIHDPSKIVQFSMAAIDDLDHFLSAQKGLSPMQMAMRTLIVKRVQAKIEWMRNRQQWVLDEQSQARQ